MQWPVPRKSSWSSSNGFHGLLASSRWNMWDSGGCLPPLQGRHLLLQQRQIDRWTKSSLTSVWQKWRFGRSRFKWKMHAHIPTSVWKVLISPKVYKMLVYDGLMKVNKMILRSFENSESNMVLHLKWLWYVRGLRQIFRRKSKIWCSVVLKHLDRWSDVRCGNIVTRNGISLCFGSRHCRWLQ